MTFPSVVRAFLFNPDGKVLLVKHKKDSPWVLPGGHVESGESLHTAMLRELSEEVGIKARFFDIDATEVLHHKGKKLTHLPIPISIYSLSYSDAHGKDKSRTEYVFLMETDDTIKTTQEAEIAEHKWFDVDEILTMKPNIDTWDFIIEMLEKIVGEDDDESL